MSAGMTAVKQSGVGIDGVSVTVKCKTGGVAVVAEPDADGYIFGLEETEEATIIIEIDPGINVFGFSVDGNKNITPAKNYSQAGRVYRKKVPIHIPIHEGKEPYTLYHENHLRLLQLEDDGYFAIYEVAIVFQNGLGFLTTQRVYEELAFCRDGVYLSCPEFDEKWPQLVDFIKTIIVENSICQNPYLFYPKIEEYAPYTPGILTEHLTDNNGVIDWFNVARGVGVVMTKEGPAFFQYKDVNSSKRLVCPSAREEVLFEKLTFNENEESNIPWKASYIIAA